MSMFFFLLLPLAVFGMHVMQIEAFHVMTYSHDRSVRRPQCTASTSTSSSTSTSLASTPIAVDIIEPSIDHRFQSQDRNEHRRWYYSTHKQKQKQKQSQSRNHEVAQTSPATSTVTSTTTAVKNPATKQASGYTSHADQAPQRPRPHNGYDYVGPTMHAADTSETTYDDVYDPYNVHHDFEDIFHNSHRHRHRHHHCSPPPPPPFGDDDFDNFHHPYHTVDTFFVDSFQDTEIPSASSPSSSSPADSTESRASIPQQSWEDTVVDAELDLRQAMLTADLNVMDALLDDDVRILNHLDQYVTKQQEIGYYEFGNIQMLDIQWEDIQVLAVEGHPDIALVILNAHIVAEINEMLPPSTSTSTQRMTNMDTKSSSSSSSGSNTQTNTDTTASTTTPFTTGGHPHSYLHPYQRHPHLFQDHLQFRRVWQKKKSNIISQPHPDETYSSSVTDSSWWKLIRGEASFVIQDY